jgi:hypothetical protein
MTTRVTPIQFLRSQVANKRPDPQKLLPGQPAVNTSSSQPGLFFSDDTGNSLIKIGPCTVGTVPPNTGAVGAGSGNTPGELWLDTDGDSPLFPGPMLKVWNGSAWVNCFPSPTIYAVPLVSDTEPSTSVHPVGTLWWNSETGLMYILYQSPAPSNVKQWVQVSSNTVA